MIRLAVDIGGTFTDVVLDADGERTSVKVLTTYDDPANGVIEGLTQILTKNPAVQFDLVIHGTTLATNALIERRGAVTALLTTAGHRDAVEMAFENRFEQYDIGVDRPEPLVPRYLRLPVTERLSASGDVLIALDEQSVHAAIQSMRAQGVESVAIGFLHAYANPEHEQRVAELVSAALPDVSVTLSSAVCPEIREFERLSTACANAYVKPLMSAYLGSLVEKLAAMGVSAPVLMMTSGGGLTTIETAREHPIRLVESGPAGGAILAASIAQRIGAERVLSFDMGGTTAKICLIDDGAPQLSRAFEVDRTYRFKKGSGLPVRIPVIEMVEIGAGGGSIASVDRLQRINVGPESAGSEPGPAAYGRGGVQPTVTDADVMLGKIDPAAFAGGAMPLDAGAAEAAVMQSVSRPLALEANAGAAAIAEVVDENMAAASRAHAVEWGRDTASRTMIAFGGAAPLHATHLADKLKIDRVVVPASAGVGSAVGFLLAPVAFEVVRSRHALLAQLDERHVESMFAEMRAEASEIVQESIGSAETEESRRAYMRYVGQGYEVSVPVPAGGSLATGLKHAFEAQYAALYGRVIPDRAVEVLSWTLTVSERQAPPTAQPAVAGRANVEAVRTRLLRDGVNESGVEAAVHARSALAPGDRVLGPALIEEAQTTTVVSPGFGAFVDIDLNLVLERVDGNP